MTSPAPAFGSLIKMPTGGFTALPDATSPYYVGGKDGLFLHRRLMFGHGVVRLTKWPENFPEMGADTGQFSFDAEPIPGALMSQIVHFFKRIYEKQKTEATVILTMHKETKEWGVFIPTQLVSHGGVNYVFDPAHISRDRMIVGSIHSHCDFSAFHSSTDTGDAEGFDGFHATIGQIMKPTPEIVAMVAMNKEFLHYKPDQFPALFDYSQLWTVEAPLWWDRYVGGNSATSAKPVGHEMYTKFAKPTEIKNHTSVNDNHKWQDGRGWTQSESWTPGGNWKPSQYNQQPSTHKAWWESKDKDWLLHNGYRWDAKMNTYRYESKSDQTRTERSWDSRPLRESQKFNKKTRTKYRALSKGESAGLYNLFACDPDQWDDTLAEDLADALYSSSVLTEDDWDQVTTNPAVWSDEKEWKALFVEKILDCVNTLKLMGVETEVRFGAGTDSTIINPANPNTQHITGDPAHVLP